VNVRAAEEALMRAHSEVRLPEHKANVPEEKLEFGHTLLLCGWLCWIFMALVLVFRSAEARAGGTALANAATVLGVLGVVLYIAGRILNRRPKA